MALACALVVSANGQFAQQGGKLIGTGASGYAAYGYGGGLALQGYSVALSADGSTAIVGGPNDGYTSGSGGLGAAWVYTQSGGVWAQQGSKLVGAGAVGNADEGCSVALSGDGNTAIVGGCSDNSSAGAVWVFTRSGGVWTQQGSKLVGTGEVGGALQGFSAALSADGNTAIVGGYGDNSSAGAVWVFTRSGGVWAQQGSKLVGNGAVGAASQGRSVALSSDGNTAIAGGPGDGSGGAAWVFTRSGGVWTQQGGKLVGSGAVGNAKQGTAVALSSDGSTAIVGGPSEGSGGAAWVFTRSGGVWTQQGGKLFGTGAVGNADQGYSVALSADGNTAVVGGPCDSNGGGCLGSVSVSGGVGAAWVYTRSGGAWTQLGSKLVGAGATGNAEQGYSVALSGDGNTAFLGGPLDNYGCCFATVGATWVFARPPSLTLSPSSLPPATLNAPYSAQLTVSGGTAPYSFSLLSGNLPTGLIMPANGLISGTPTQQTTVSFTVQARDVNGLTGQLAYTLSVVPATPLTLGPASLPAATLDFAYSVQLTGSGGAAPYSFSVVSGSLPTGLALSLSGLISGSPTQQGAASFTVQVRDAINDTAQLTYTLTVGANASSCTYSVNPPSASLQISGGTSGFTVSTQAGCASAILIDDNWIHLTSPASLTGGGSVALSVDANASPAGRASVVGVTNAAGAVVGTYAIAQAGVAASITGLTFVALPPCRVMDTRTGNGFTGPFGPPSFTAGQTRTVNPLQSVCNVPATAEAYVTNVTLLPQAGGHTNNVTIYPSDEVQPRYTTASAGDGNIVANSAIIRAGATNGAINVYSTDNTDILIDISGYFTNSGANLVFYPLTPCRVVDTRAAARGPGPFGSPSMVAGEIRQYQFPASPYCLIPSGAAAYSTTITVVPPGPLFFLTAWPAGIPTPPVASNVNSFNGRTVPNSAIIPASADGSIQIYVSNPTDFFIDINGYFAPNDGKTGLSYYPVRQCTAANSADELYSGAFGGPSYPGGARSIAVPASPFCAVIPSTAAGYAVDLTANPYANSLAYVTLYPTGSPVPTASMLNDFQGQIVTNSAIVPAGPNGSIDVFTNGGPADIQLMISGYFSR